MDGRNSTGSKVSLLNDSSDVAPLATKAHHQLPSLAAAHYHSHHHQQHHSHFQQHHHHHSSRAHSRASSRTSTPSLSPQTPPLVRSDSSDSRTFGSPSPLTPAHHYSSHDRQQQDRQQQYFIVQHRYGKMDDPAMSMYPPPDASNLAMPSAYALPAQLPVQVAPPVQQPMQNMQPMQQQYRASASPSSEPSRVSTVSAASNGARPAAPKKNQYPCPLSKQFNCADYFTTSGHAARHAKKHTGKKDAFCPECNKAFTRKDNMEQHRRTHQSGRNAAKGAERDVKKAKHQAKRPKPAPLQSSTMPSLSQLSMVDPSLPLSPSGFAMAPAVQSSDSFLEFPPSSRYPDPAAYSYNPAPAQYGGLDALAIAASGEKRKFES
jgi:hypothetical protein